MIDLKFPKNQLIFSRILENWTFKFFRLCGQKFYKNNVFVRTMRIIRKSWNDILVLFNNYKLKDLTLNCLKKKLTNREILN